MPARAAATSGLALGDIRLTYLADGIILMPPQSFYAGDTTELFAAGGHVLDERGDLVMSLGSLLIETAGKRVLVDLAWGPSAVDVSELTGGRHRGRVSGGGLLGSLASAGLAPSDIDVVLLSHLHADHIGWLTTETAAGPALTFDRAEHLLAESEWQYWAGSGTSRTAGPSEEQLSVLRDRFTPMADGSSPAPGITAMHTPGHTPGHCSFVVSSGSARAVVLGDTLHCPLEIAHPELDLLADVDPAAARATRDRLRQELAAPDTTTVGTHFPDVVFGRVVPTEADRVFVPVS